MPTVDTMQGALITQWTTSMRATGHPESTIEQYTRYVTRFATHTNPATATITDIETWMANHSWKPATRRAAGNAIRAFYRWGASRGLTPDLADQVPKCRVPRGCAHPASDDVIAAAMTNTHGTQWWLLRIASATGLRRAELAALHTDQVELIDGSWWLRIVGKGGVTRLVPIPDDVAEWLRSRQGWAFPSSRKPGEHVLPPTIGKWAKRALSTCSTHTLRHRYATCAYRSTGDLLAVQQLLGHASPVTTQGYILQSPERLTAAASATWAA